jgi:hypothetical protein
MPHFLNLHVYDSANNAHLIDLLSVDLTDIIWTWHTIFYHFHGDWCKNLELSALLMLSLGLITSEGPEVSSLGEASSIVICLEKSSGIVGELHGLQF